MEILTRNDYVMVPEREIDPGTGDLGTAVMVGFALQAKVDGRASVKAGTEVYKEVEFVKVQIPGDKFTVFEQPATDAHRKRFPIAYEKFKRRDLVGIEGTPLEHWPALSRSVALTLRAANIETVEALAEVSDGHIDRLGHGYRELRTKARAYLAHAKDTAAVQKEAAEKEKLQRQIQDLQAQMAAMAAQLPANTQNATAKVHADGVIDQVRAVSIKNDVVAAARRPRARPTA